VDWQDLARLRSPGFTEARRGYDRHEVDKFLEQLVDWLETDAAEDIGQVAVTRKLELVGKSTAHILLTTEQEAQELRRQTEEDCAELRAGAEADAQKVRDAGDAYAQQVRAKSGLRRCSKTPGSNSRALRRRRTRSLPARCSMRCCAG
jgi:DivIVA domain-containing protein